MLYQKKVKRYQIQTTRHIKKRSKVYQKWVKRYIRKRSKVYQKWVRNISISGQRDGRQYPPKRVKPLNFRVQIYNIKTPLSSLFGKIILHKISNH